MVPRGSAWVRVSARVSAGFRPAWVRVGPRQCLRQCGIWPRVGPRGSAWVRVSARVSAGFGPAWVRVPASVRDLGARGSAWVRVGVRVSLRDLGPRGSACVRVESVSVSASVRDLGPLVAAWLRSGSQCVIWACGGVGLVFGWVADGSAGRRPADEHAGGMAGWRAAGCNGKFERETAYADCYEEADWLPVAVYLKKAGANLAEFDTPQKQVDFVKLGLREEIKYIGGKPGVIEHAESFGNAAACEQIYKAADDANASVLKGRSLQDVRRLVSEHHAESEPETKESRAGSECMEEAPKKPKRVFPGQESQPNKRRAAEAVSTGRPAIREDVVASSAAAPAETLSVKPKVESATPKSRQNPGKLSKKHSDLLSKGHTLLEKNMETFSVSNMWAGGMRKRSLESAQKALASISTSLLTMPHTEEGENLCTKINSWCDSVEEEFDFLQAIKKDPASFVSPSKINNVGMEILLRMSVQNLSTILLWVANEFLKGLDFDARAESSSEKFFAVCACHHDQSLTVGLVFRAASRGAPSFAPQVASNFQQQILSVWYDRVFRTKSVDKFRSLVGMPLGMCMVVRGVWPAMWRFSRCQIEKVDLFRFSSDKPSANDLSLPDSGTPGRAFSSLVEMEAQVLRTMCTADWDKDAFLRTDRAIQAVDALKALPQTSEEKLVASEGMKLLHDTCMSLGEGFWTDELSQQVTRFAGEPLSRLVSWLMHFKVVSAKLRAALFRVADVLSEMVGCQVIMRAADKKLTVESFIAAVRAMSKLSKSKHPQDLRQAIVEMEIQSTGEGLIESLVSGSFLTAFFFLHRFHHTRWGRSLSRRQGNPFFSLVRVKRDSPHYFAGQDAVLASLLAAAKQVVQVFEFDAKRDRQVAWLKLLLGSKKDEMLQLDASLKASLDATASSFLRSVEVVVELAKAETPVHDLDLFTKTGVKELMSRFVQISELGTEELVAAGVESAKEVKDGLFSALRTVLSSLTDQIKEGKSTLVPLADKYRKILGAVSDWNEDRSLLSSPYFWS
eukprot:s714_g16.t1